MNDAPKHEETSDDGESIMCPWCEKEWADLWDYDWSSREEIETECPHCSKPILLSRIVSVTYRCRPVTPK